MVLIVRLQSYPTYLFYFLMFRLKNIYGILLDLISDNIIKRFNLSWIWVDAKLES